MLVILPYFRGDQPAAERLADWIGELGGAHGHELLLVPDIRADDLTERFKPHFDKIETEWVRDDAWNKWPESANNMFRKGGKRVEFLRTDIKYFLWLEPDAVPLKEGWIDILEAEFKEGVRQGKRFMGERVQVENVPVHMSGIGFYPSPLSAFAGFAYLAQDVAWDCYAAGDIIPKCHWTKLICHAWKHPTFTNTHELTTQIHKEAVLFHASKDGSLIELLRKQKRGEIVEGGDATCRSVNENLEKSKQDSVIASEAAPTVQPVSAALDCDIFIKTYPKDYPWLDYCLRSIDKFCSGFRKTTIIYSGEPKVTEDDPVRPKFQWNPNTMSVIGVGEQPDGYLWQQVIKMDADKYTHAEYILFTDSDTIFTCPVTPQAYMTNGKINWMMTPIEESHPDEKHPWRAVMAKFMKRETKYEFMRRHPFLVPRWALEKFRNFCQTAHGMDLTTYIMTQPYRQFSEFNCLGFYLYEYHRDKFHWIDTSKDPWPTLTVDQRWSHGGLTEELKASWENILSGGVERQVYNDAQTTVPPPSQPPEWNVGNDEMSYVDEKGDSRWKSNLGKVNGELTIGDHIRAIRDYSRQGTAQRNRVLNELRRIGLRKVKPRQKHR